MNRFAWLLLASLLGGNAALAEAPAARAPSAAREPFDLCTRRWHAHPKTQRECQLRQREAEARVRPRLRAVRAAGIHSPEAQVVAMCELRGGHDWTRIERCMNTQLASYWSLYPSTQPLAPPATAPAAPAPEPLAPPAAAAPPATAE